MTIRTEYAGGIATLTLDRPNHGNALDLPTVRAFRDAIEAIRSDEGIRVVIIAASGKVFCGGGDVRAMAAATDRPALLAELAGVMHDALAVLRTLPVPILARVQGTAAGAGLGLVLAADIAIAASTARFLTAYSAIGLSPDCGVTALLPSTVGPRRAALLALTDRTLTAADAVDWGLISEACPPEALAARVDDIAHGIAARAGESARQTARLLRLAHDRGYAESLSDEAATISRLSATEEASVLINAFANRTAERPA